MYRLLKKHTKSLIRPVGKYFNCNSSILLYHRIAEPVRDPQMLCVSPEKFEDHISMLVKKFKPVRLSEIVDRVKYGKKLLPRTTAITFDDGYLDNLDKAVPILEKYKVPATIFIASGCIKEGYFWWDFVANLILYSKHVLPINISISGEVFRWDLTKEKIIDSKWVAGECLDNARISAYNVLIKEIKPLSKRERDHVLQLLCKTTGVEYSIVMHGCPPLMKEKDILELASSKMIDIGGHTVNHLKLSCFEYKDQYEEIKYGCDDLERILNSKIELFAYPFGSKADYNKDSIRAVDNLGISASCANWTYKLDVMAYRNQLPRILCRNFSTDILYSKITEKQRHN